jgi:hypothetical protein
MRELFVSGAASQFLLYGNVLDLVPTVSADGQRSFLPLRDFLEEVLLVPFEVVIFYDRGKGLRVKRGGDLFQQWLKVFDSFQGTAFAAGPTADPQDPARALDRSGLLPREPHRALELIDRFLRAGLHRTRLADDGSRVADPLRCAVVIDYAQFLVPQAEAVYLAGELSEHLIKILDWATDPNIATAPLVTCLLSPNLNDLNRQVVECPYSAKIQIALPNADEVEDFVRSALAGLPGALERCELPPEKMAPKLVGLSRANIRALLHRTV